MGKRLRRMVRMAAVFYIFAVLFFFVCLYVLVSEPKIDFILLSLTRVTLNLLIPAAIAALGVIMVEDAERQVGASARSGHR